MTAAAPDARFATTRWSVVLAASRGPDGGALETLCRAYWYPLYAYVRRAGHAPHDAQDLTQEFFARLLEKEWLEGARPERGRFRSFLITMLKRFLINDWHEKTTLKRGGRIQHVPLDVEDAERRFAAEPDLPADAVFERRWALTLLEQTLADLQAEFTSAGRAEDFEAMKHTLTMGREDITHAQLAEKLGCAEGTARVAVHRLRKRYRELFREHIATTLSAGEDLDEEVRHVIAVLGR